MRRIALVSLLLAAFSAPDSSEQASEPQVLQIKQTFDPNTIKVAPGAAVEFMNMDDVNHNLKVVAPDGSVTDLGLDKPGETTKIGFPASGSYTVICGIHPRMKMKVAAQ